MRPLVLAFVGIAFVVLAFSIFLCAEVGDLLRVAACPSLLEFVRRVVHVFAGP
jgi:hypothetical protein